MCLILFAYKASDDWPLVVASNRDEAYQRPTKEAHFWIDAPHVLAGRDLEKGGTWMGVDKSGRFAAVTNYREGVPSIHQAPRSRGELIEHFFRQNASARQYLDVVKGEGEFYAGFSCLMGDMQALYFYSNRMEEIKAIDPGVHGLSNAFLDTPWPKVQSGREELSQLLSKPETLSRDAVFQMLHDQRTYEMAQLPRTGIESAREKALSAKFIAVDERYGTRSSTVIMVHASGQVHYEERSFEPWGKCFHTSNFQYELTPT